MLSISESIFHARLPPLAKFIHGHLENMVKVTIEWEDDYVDKSGDEDGGEDHFVDVDLELLLELVEVFLGSLASPHPAGWGVVKPATSKNSEEIFGKSQFLPNLNKYVLKQHEERSLWAVARPRSMEEVG